MDFSLCLFACLACLFVAPTPPSAESDLPGILLSSRASQTPGSTGRLENPTYMRALQPIGDLSKFLREETSPSEKMQIEGEEEEEEEERSEELGEGEPEEEEEEEEEEVRLVPERQARSQIVERKVANERQKKRVLERLRRIQEELDDEEGEEEERAEAMFDM